MSRINLTDEADTIASKVRKAKTDPEPLPSEAAKGLAERPEARNLVGIYAALAGASVDDVLARTMVVPSSPNSSRQWRISPSPRSGRLAMKCGVLLSDPAEIDADPAQGRRSERARLQRRSCGK